MEYSLIDDGDKKRLVFYGNIIPSSRSKFLEVSEKMPASEQKHWLLEVQEFEYIDSAGLGMLIELQENGKKHGIKMSIAGANRLVKRMFDLSRFDKLFDILD